MKKYERPDMRVNSTRIRMSILVGSTVPGGGQTDGFDARQRSETFKESLSDLTID